MLQNFLIKLRKIFVFFDYFSAEDSAEASGFGRTQFWVVRSFTSAYNGTMYSLHTFCLNTTLRVSKVEHVLYSKEE